MAARAATLAVTELADGEGFVVTGLHTHHVDVDGSCNCIAFGLAPMSARWRCKHQLATAARCGVEAAMSDLRVIATKLAQAYGLTRKAAP